MDRDSRIMRGDRPYLFTNLKSEEGLDQVIAWIKKDVILNNVENACYEVVVSITEMRVISWNHIPGVQPPTDHYVG